MSSERGFNVVKHREICWLLLLLFFIAPPRFSKAFHNLLSLVNVSHHITERTNREEKRKILEANVSLQTFEIDIGNVSNSNSHLCKKIFLNFLIDWNLNFWVFNFCKKYFRQCTLRVFLNFWFAPPSCQLLTCFGEEKKNSGKLWYPA